MIEIWNLAIQNVNLAYTMFLGFVMVYWLMLILGAVDISFLDIDLDLDVDGEVDINMDTGEGGFFFQIAEFFNLGHVPLMLFISFFALSLWSVSMGFSMMTGNESISMAGMIAIPNILASVFIAKYAVLPFVPIFKAMDMRSPETHGTLIGRTGIISSMTVTEKYGEINLTTKGAPHILSVRSSEEGLSKGDKVLIVEQDRESNTYEVIKFTDLEK